MTTPAHEVEEWLDSLDPERIEWKDAAHLRAVAKARDELGQAEQALRAAIRDAHDHGDSWTAIGMVLGISRQAAHRKYAGGQGNQPGEERSE
ncbi:hypothetical protein [Agromyces sp. NPDC049794]|uniref:hypothetical protein n=1 Tax=unclassified Agromyces TaxID=2639701 RepID=UPI0033CF154D